MKNTKKKLVQYFVMLMTGLMLSATVSGQENQKLSTQQLVPQRIYYKGDSLAGFTRHQEEVLIQKMYYKQMYREDVLMWMDLWEKQRLRNLELMESLTKFNKRLKELDAQIIWERNVRQIAEENALEAQNQVKEERHKTWFWKNRATPAGIILGFIIGLLVN